jgi:hypothetical protein
MPRAIVSWLSKQYLYMLLVIGLFLSGCVASPASLFRPQPAFPSLKVIQNGDYRGFLAENRRNLSECGSSMACDVILFNLGFVYAYPQSPYRDPQKARQYLHQLRSRFPQSPWTSQGQMLLGFMNEQVSLEEAQRRLRTDLRARDTTIQKLQGQLDRSREIDIDLEKKERELFR